MKFTDEMARVTKLRMYIEDLFDRFPGGYPLTLEPILEKIGIRVKEKLVVLSEPFDIGKSADPMKI